MRGIASASHIVATPSNRWSARTLRFAGVLLTVGGCTAFLAVPPATAQAQNHGVTGSLSTAAKLIGPSSTAHFAVSTFCGHLPTSQVSNILGTTVSLSEAVLEKTSLECIYFGKAAASVSHPIDEVVITMQPNIPASELATRAAAEARIAAESPKDVKVIFASLPSVNPTGFSWTYAQALNGGQLVGVANNKGTTGYGVALGGAAKTFGTASGHIPVAERLLALGMAA